MSVATDRGVGGSGTAMGILVINRFVALMAVLFWPLIPLFWIPVHAANETFRRVGRFTYVLVAGAWILVACAIYRNRDFILGASIGVPSALRAIEILLLLSGTALHVWTGVLLGIWGLIGLPEISLRLKSKLVTEGPFAVVRHPPYLGHPLMFSGVFLMTGVVTMAYITLLDLLIINAIIVPLEERELLRRFGEPYRLYRNRVPRLFPHLRRTTT